MRKHPFSRAGFCASSCGASAAAIGKRDYGLHVGNEATFLVLNAPNGAAAVAGVPRERVIVRRGEFWSSGSDALVIGR